MTEAYGGFTEACIEEYIPKKKCTFTFSIWWNHKIQACVSIHGGLRVALEVGLAIYSLSLVFRGVECTMVAVSDGFTEACSEEHTPKKKL